MTEPPQVPDPTPPQWSADGSAWWDGYRWIPRHQVPPQYGGGHDAPGAPGIALPGARRTSPVVGVVVVLVALAFFGVAASFVGLGVRQVTGGVFEDSEFDSDSAIVVPAPAWPENRLGAVLANARDAEETYRSATGRYTSSTEELSGSGFVPARDVRLTIASAGGQSYCLQATGTDGVLFYASGTDTPTTMSCA